MKFESNGDLRWQEQVGGVPTGRQYITDDGSGMAQDGAAAIRVTLESGGVDHRGDVFLFGEMTATGGASKYGVARWNQIDPCGSDPDCCN